MTLYLFYHGPVTPQGARNVEVLTYAALKDGAKEVTLCLASEGGDVNAGIGLFNFLKMMPITINTHAAGLCDSIAATIYVAGAHRTASALSAFTTHQATYVLGDNAGKRAPNTDLISKPFKDLLGWSEEDLSQRFGAADFRFSPAQGIALGMVHEIIELKLGAGDELITVQIP